LRREDRVGTAGRVDDGWRGARGRRVCGGIDVEAECPVACVGTIGAAEVSGTLFVVGTAGEATVDIGIAEAVCLRGDILGVFLCDSSINDDFALPVTAGSVEFFLTFSGWTSKSGDDCFLAIDSLEPLPVLKARMLGSALSGACVNAGDHAGGGSTGKGGTSGTTSAVSRLSVPRSGLLLDLVFAEDMVDGRVVVQDFDDCEEVKEEYRS
jgi:hypothetical protein